MKRRTHSVGTVAEGLAAIEFKDLDPLRGEIAALAAELGVDAERVIAAMDRAVMFEGAITPADAIARIRSGRVGLDAPEWMKGWR